MRNSVLLLAAFTLAGCASLSPDRGFDKVAAEAEQRGGYRAQWIGVTAADSAAASAEAALLRDTLSAEGAVQVALLRNPRLQSTYEELGIAQAAAVQAGLLRNPVFGAGAGFPLEGGAPDLAFSVALDFLGILYLPMRKAIAASSYEAARLRVTEEVLAVASETKAAYYSAVIAEERARVAAELLRGAEVTYEAARLLREAGNTSAYTFLQEKALYEELRLERATTELAAAEQREVLTGLLGVGGASAGYRLPDRVPALPTHTWMDSLSAAEAEQRAMAASLALAAARQDVITYGRRLGLATPEALLPDLEVGAEAEWEEGHWKLGPEVEIALPLFDAGQARRAAARAELRQRQEAVRATALDVRSAARTLRARLLTARLAAEHYADVLVPLRAEIARQALLQYNAMQIGVFGVLEAREAHVRSTMRYYDALMDFWQARTDYELLLQGGSPVATGRPMSLPADAPTGPARGGDH